MIQPTLGAPPPVPDHDGSPLSDTDEERPAIARIGSCGLPPCCFCFCSGGGDGGFLAVLKRTSASKAARSLSSFCAASGSWVRIASYRDQVRSALPVSRWSVNSWRAASATGAAGSTLAVRFTLLRGGAGPGSVPVNIPAESW